jgi:hypothetical protein
VSASTTTECAAVADMDAILGEHWHGLEWRLSNLYWIVNKAGHPERFDPNPEQLDLVRNLHTRNLVLKARQKGFSTLIQLIQLDQALFNGTHVGATIAETLPNAGKLFKKIEFAHARLPQALQDALPIKALASKSAMEFEHGSAIYVGVSARGDTLQLLHISEFGAICRKYPERAAEIVSGAFEAVPMADGCIVVESTAEGAAGPFFELVSAAKNRQDEGSPESVMDWRLHFYPWFQSGEYRLDPAGVIVSDADHRYFNGLQAKLGIVVDPAQRAWYVKKRETLKRNMKREYPSTVEEAFEQAVEGAIFGEEMTTVREAGRICEVPLDLNFPVHTLWDFGLGRRNPIWLCQRIGLQTRWVKYFDDYGKGLAWWWRTLEDWRKEHGGFSWGTHHLPHDADAEILGESVTTKRRILAAAGMERIHVVPRVAQKSIGIDLMRAALPTDNWFDRVECAEGIKCLDGYQFEWNEKLGVWGRAPLGNWASHGADAWMQYAQGFQGNGAGVSKAAIRKHVNRKKSWN